MKAGYLGVLSIEHEDSALSCEQGFVLEQRHLSQFCRPLRSAPHPRSIVMP